MIKWERCPLFRVDAMQARTQLLSSALGFGLSITCGCVLGPRDEQLVITTQALAFSGLASQPSSEIIIEAFDLSSSQWEQIGSTVSSPYLSTIGGRAFYTFYTSVTIQSLPDWQCYYEASCDLSDEGCRDIRFRVREPSGLTSTLFTYTEESFDCTFDLVIQDLEDAYESYVTCNPGYPQEIVARSCFLH